MDEAIGGRPNDMRTAVKFMVGISVGQSRLRRKRLPSASDTGKMPDAGGSPAGHSLEPNLQAHLGAQLRAAYQEVVIAPVPSRFLQLLDNLALEEAKADEQ
jgi:hypothetical protein